MAVLAAVMYAWSAQAPSPWRPYSAVAHGNSRAAGTCCSVVLARGLTVPLRTGSGPLRRESPRDTTGTAARGGQRSALQVSKRVCRVEGDVTSRDTVLLLVPAAHTPWTR